MKYRTIYLAFILAASMLLTACGGNGGSGQSQSTAAVDPAGTSDSQAGQVPSSSYSVESSQESAPDMEPIYIDAVNSFEAMVDMTYEHGDIDELHFGNDELATLTITASPAGLGGEDFLIFDEKDCLVASPSDVKDVGDQTIITYTIQPVSAGKSTLYIVPTYDIDLEDEAENQESKAGDRPGQNSQEGRNSQDGQTSESEASVLRTISYPVLVLDYTEGRVVYINESREAETGKVYHTDIVDAGEGCRRTTVYDAEANGYKPCGNCRQ